MNPLNLSTLFEVISTPPSRIVGDDICSSQEFQTTRFQSFADRSARRRGERERKRNREKRETETGNWISLYLERRYWKEKRWRDPAPRATALSLRVLHRPNKLLRPISTQELPWSLPLASCCCSLIDTLKLHFFPFRYFFLICELQQFCECRTFYYIYPKSLQIFSTQNNKYQTNKFIRFIDRFLIDFSKDLYIHQ